jgi:hypothetical protein
MNALSGRDSIVPIRVPGVAERLLDDELVLYLASDETVHVLNRTGAAVWALCDGNRDVDQVTNEVAELFGQRPSNIREDVEVIVDELARVGLIANTSVEVGALQAAD